MSDASSPGRDVPPELLVHVGIARPGDAIIVAYSRQLTDAEMDHIGQMVDEHLPGLKVALFDGVSSVTMYRPTAGG